MAITQAPIYQEVYRFLASRPTHEEILAFRPQPETQARVRQLLEANKEGRLTPDEESELDEFERVEHFIRMLKLHTQQLMENK